MLCQRTGGYDTYFIFVRVVKVDASPIPCSFNCNFYYGVFLEMGRFLDQNWGNGEWVSLSEFRNPVQISGRVEYASIGVRGGRLKRRPRKSMDAVLSFAAPGRPLRQESASSVGVIFAGLRAAGRCFDRKTDFSSQFDKKIFRLSLFALERAFQRMYNKSNEPGNVTEHNL